MLFGVTRKQGTKARGEILISGKADTTISAGAIVLKTDSTKYKLLYDTTIAFNGKAVAEVECLQIGASVHPLAERQRREKNIPGAD